MATMMDYIKWRGDLSFSQTPFCDVDNLILACLSYVDFNDIIPKDGSTITIAEASREFFSRHTKKELAEARSFFKFAPQLLEDAGASMRFGSAQLRYYDNIISEERGLQFSAVEILIDDGTSYIAFRGTDNTLVGWKEDFYMSLGNVPAEHAAKEYLSEIGKRSARMLRVGGHSKGGHLAVYAAANCDLDVEQKILAVYDNDGPGFAADLDIDPDFERILPKLHRFIPEFSIFGLLMNHNAEATIVKSRNKGYLQHDASSWQVEGTGFITAPAVHPNARLFERSLKEWLYQLNMDDRKSLIDDIFSVLEASGINTAPELMEKGLRNMPAMLKQLNKLHPETRDKVDALLRILINQWAGRLFS